jgi:hypothetical protein
MAAQCPCWLRKGRVVIVPRVVMVKTGEGTGKHYIFTPAGEADFTLVADRTRGGREVLF